MDFFTVIMITGGSPARDVGNLVELLSSNGTHICELQSLPDNRYAHSQNGLVACGGGNTVDSCLIFADGSWKKHGTTLLNRRWHHSSWIRGNEVMLIGGGFSPNTTETISFNGVHQAAFYLEHRTEYKITLVPKNYFNFS